MYGREFSLGLFLLPAFSSALLFRRVRTQLQNLS